jgi:RNA polymerase sigma factor (sigma-70 family)
VIVIGSFEFAVKEIGCRCRKVQMGEREEETLALAEPLQRTATAVSQPTDSDLLQEALAGEPGAFEALYSRHVDAAYRTGCAVARNRHDASDAVAEAFTRLFQRINEGRLGPDVNFRAYLLASVRNAAHDLHRVDQRRSTTDDDDVFDTHGITSTPAEVLVGSEEAALIVRAFEDLPERWRYVLWLTEVEGMAPRDAAEHLGISANNTAQLAHRARNRLRERYLNAHVDGATLPSTCQFTTERLGAYVGGALSRRDTMKVETHLTDCGECQDRLAVIEEVGSTLRRSMLPIPLVLAGAGGAAQALSAAGISATSAAGASTTAGATHLVGSGLGRLQKLAQTAVAGGTGLAVAMGSLFAFDAAGQTPGRGDGLDRDRLAIEQPATAEVPLDEAALEIARDSDVAYALPRLDRFAAPDPVDQSTAADDPTADAPTATAPTVTDPAVGDGTGDVAPPETDAVEPLAQTNVGLSLLGEPIGASVGVGDGSSTGVTAGPLTVGDTTAVPETDGVTLETEGELLPSTNTNLM